MNTQTPPTLNTDHTVTVFECQPPSMRSTITLPKGTRLVLVKNASGTEGDLYAVADVALLVRLTGNDHDPKYRYVFVPDSVVAH